MKTIIFFGLCLLSSGIQKANQNNQDDISSDVEVVLGSNVEAEEITYRFYYLKRLERSVNLLYRCFNSGLLEKNLYFVSQEKGITLAGIPFYQECVVSAIRNINHKQTLKPLFKIWKVLNSYKFIHDKLIIKEFTTLLVYILHENALSCGISFSKADLFLKGPGRVQGLAAMPLEDVLDILDLLVDELPDFLEKYEFDSEMTWYEWGKKYGVIALIAGAALGLRLYLMYNGVDHEKQHGSTPPPPSGAQSITLN